MSNLERAIEIAVSAHKGQRRKDGSPYVLHPLRLMMSVCSNDEKIVAVLHDAVEDTPVTFEQLQNEGFSNEVLDALRLVTHESDISYADYIAEIAKNRLARSVKLADLKDNGNIYEIPELKTKDLERLEKYHNAFRTLTDAENAT